MAGCSIVVRQARSFSTHFSVATLQGNMKINTMRAPQYVGHSSSRSMMSYNEDRLFVGFLDLPIRDEPQSVFNAAVFDGHGGSQFADFLLRDLANYVERADIPAWAASVPEQFREKFGGYWRSTRVLTSANIKQFSRSVLDDLALRLPLAFLKADFDGLAQDELSGSTCTSSYLYTVDPAAHFWLPGVEVNLTVAQVGDTRALICDNLGNNIPLTTVHHADSQQESDRLARFPFGFNTTTDGVQRFLQYVNTRAFGDHQGKSRGISAEPDITKYEIGPGRGRLPGQEAFLVLVSDGVTDKASDQEICDIVIQKAMKGGSLRGSPQEAAYEITSYVGMLGTRDNATALVIRLGGWGSWTNWSDRSGKLRVDRLKHNLRRQ